LRNGLAHAGALFVIALANAVAFSLIAAVDVLLIHPANRLLKPEDELWLSFTYSGIFALLAGFLLALPVVLVLRKTTRINLPKLAILGAIAAVTVGALLEGVSERSAVFLTVNAFLGVLSACLWWFLIERRVSARD
jgi:hypothetical protein